MRVIAVLALVAWSATAAAQVQMRPTDPPLVTAVNDTWYILGEPLQFSGELYFRAGATVFFNGNSMVRVGHYNGVPLYADTTVEPFSVILVPISRGVMQPYERPRRGELAGTSGSRAPSFPTALRPDATVIAMAPSAPTAPPLPVGAISVYTPDIPSAPVAPARDVAGTTGFLATPPAAAAPIVSLRRPENNDGIWIRFLGLRWASTGTSVSAIGDFERVGDYAGLPVFRRANSDDPVIYLPTAAGRFAAYRARE
jgi:hypothetical protein